MNSLQIRSLLVATLLWGGMTKIGLAQIVPDATLGSETSVVNQTLEPGTTWIEGGATRNSALFHSFSDFNVNDGQRVYFANPATIETIFSRVTGSNPSRIFGTLGVGGSADLFLINPQGILFGPGARLDISGSFTASTAESLVFGNGLEFSSLNPTGAPLLQVNVQPGLQGGIQEIQSLGELKAGKNLTLQGGNLEIAGQLQAGRNLWLQGQTVNISDQADRPLKLLAGGNLTLEGAEHLGISALSHPGSFLYGGNQLTLRSDQPVIGDAHFYSGSGGFRVETLDGALNRLVSPDDPVIRTSGDVTIAGYLGSSLHIIAGGSVTIENGNYGYAITLTGTDPIRALRETITLSDGTPVQIDGTARPTLDIRAGVTDPTKLAPPGSISISGDISVGQFPPIENYAKSLNDYAAPTSGNITINGPIYLGNSAIPDQFGTIIFPENRADNAQIVMTNQWGCTPNCLPGNISISTIALAPGNLGQLAELWIDSSGDLSLGTGGSSIELNSANSNGGNLTALARGSLQVNGVIQSNSINNTGVGGNIALTSGGNLIINPGYSVQSQGLQGGSIKIRSTGGDVIVNGAGSSNTVALVNISNSVATANVGQAGNIELTADSGSILLQNGARIESQGIANGTANLGSVYLTAANRIRLDGQDSTILSATSPGSTGNSGDITLTAPTIEITGETDRGALLSTGTQGSGKAGNITIAAGHSGTVTITQNSELVSSVDGQNATGQGGDISITTGRLEVVTSNINAVTRGLGKAGNISIGVAESGLLNNSQLSTVVGPNGRADGGNIDLQNAQSLTLQNNSLVSSQVERNLPFRGEGNAGNITLSNIGSISLQNGSKLTSSTEGIGNAGTIAVNNNDRLTLEGGSQISTAVGKTGQGNAGAIVLNTNNLTLTDKSAITSSTAGQGSAGSVTVTGNGTILVDSSTISTAIEATGVANSALPPSRITLTANSVTLQNGAQLTSETKGPPPPSETKGTSIPVESLPSQGGTGDAGTIVINSANRIEITGESSILSSVGLNATGNAGGIELNAGGSISLLDGSILTASTSGKGDSGAIDITAEEFFAQGNDRNGLGSAIFSTVQSAAEGNSGGINITTTGIVSLLNGALLDATTYGKGDSGAIGITAQDIYLQGEDSAGFMGGLISAVEVSGEGNSGGIRLDAKGTLSILDGARIDASTWGLGDSGAIDITAQDVLIRGEDRSGLQNSNVLSKVEITGIGNSGGITLNATGSVSLEAGGVISTTTFGQGDSGAIVINTPTLWVQGAIASEVSSNLDNVQGAGISNIQSAVADTGQGNSGTITVTAQRVSLLDGGQLNANTFGQGNSGAIVIDTQDFLAQGRSASGTYRSGVQSGVGETGIGNSQGINLTASNSATFLDGALLSASTLGVATERSNIVINT